VDIYGEFTAATTSGVYLSGLPAVNDSVITPVSPECSPVPALTYADDNSSAADFARHPDAYVAYNVSGYEDSLANAYA